MLKVFHLTKKYPTKKIFSALKTKLFIKNSFGKLLEKESILDPPCCEILDL